MVISRTPYRISFFGGGTDYPAWYKENGGAVIATTINKYCYLTCRHLPPFFKHKSRIVWSKIECINDISQIHHPSVRACLQFMNINRGIEIHHDGDLPARTGIGSSSSFTVGLLHALYALKKLKPTKRQLALNAIHLEQKILKENVGSQDQTETTFGGFNFIQFGGKSHIRVKPVKIGLKRLKLFQKHLMLSFTGFSHTASEIAGEHIKKIPDNTQKLRTMQELVNRAMEILSSDCDLSEFGKLLHENWRIKRSLTHKVSTPLINEIYSAARRAGALGGKLLGAGGGGFILFFAEPHNQPKIKKSLKKILHVPFRFENLGSQIIFSAQEDWLKHA